jgi:glycosyltransferase involved in cell wall biosynthesis
MKILVCIPALYNAEVLKECLQQVVDRTDVDVLVLDNGAEAAIKRLLTDFNYKHNIKVWHNHKNEFVNRPWNDFIAHFLDTDRYDYLCIMNSDLLLQDNWADVLRNRWNQYPDEIILPTLSDDKELMKKRVSPQISLATVVHSGTPGVFITLNKEQAKMVYPLPHGLVKIWFGDEWIFEICRKTFHKTVIPENFLAFHHWSATLQLLPNKDALLEEDKKMWEQTGKHKLAEKIESLLQQQKPK